MPSSDIHTPVQMTSTLTLLLLLLLMMMMMMVMMMLALITDAASESRDFGDYLGASRSVGIRHCSATIMRHSIIPGA